MSKYNGIFQFKNKFSVEKIVKIMSDASRESKLYKLFDYYDEFVGVSIKGLINKNKQHSSNFRRAYNEDKSNLLLICGHVFNLEKLKKKLFLVNGLASNENRDEKIILKGYKEFGNRFAEYIDGAFIIIIYDFNERKITFIRDIVGQKKLYYYVDDNILLFSSNLKPLLSTDLFEKKICNRAFNQYLQLTYIPAPLSIIENVYELNAGEILEVHINGEIHKEKYWDLIYEDSKLSLSYDYCKEYLRNNVFKTVDNMIKNKSSIGAFLSGGIDSTIMVGVMSKLSVDPINTFTIGYSKNKDYDESNLAQIVANKFGTNHHIYFLDYNEVSLEINYILNEMDEPFADSSLIPSFMISKYAKKHVDYVITGDGGDELFAGYSKYLMDYYNDKYIKIPRFLRNCFEKTLYWLPDKNSFTRKARKVVER